MKSGNGIKTSSQKIKDEIISTIGGKFIGKNSPIELKLKIHRIEIKEVKY